MIAILHSNGIAAIIINKVLAVEGDTITAKDGGAKGVRHSVLIVDGYTYGEDIIPAVYEEVVLPTVGGKEPKTESRLVSPERRLPYIAKDGVKISVGDTINTADFTDVRNQLAKTPEQLAAAKMASLEEENINLMLALTQVYEEKEADKAAAQQDSITSMLAITELYEMIIGGN